MQSYNRKTHNSGNLVFLTPSSHTESNREKNHFRGRFHSLPNWNLNAYSTPYSDRRFSSMQAVSSISSRKRGNESSVNRRSDVVVVVDDEPDNKRKKSGKAESKERDSKISYLNMLSNEMLQFSVESEQTNELLQKKLRLRSTLLAIFRREFPAASLHLVGSSCNGFASKTSDADFCLMLTQWRAVDQRVEAVMYLRRLHKLLKHCPYIKDLQVIRAKVPILKFRDSVSSCECDVNINNAVGIRNTHLLRTYSRIDKRVRPLIVIVKKWASSRNINDAHQGTLSSYSLVLMVIHFLQAGTKVPVIPSLQQQYPDYFRHDLNLDHLPMFDPAEVIPCDRSANKQSVAELLVGFLDYYANHFRQGMFECRTYIPSKCVDLQCLRRWDFLAISVRLGRATPKSLCPDAREKPIFIEEPFELTNTARSVHSWNAFDHIKSEFTRAHEMMKEKPSLEDILANDSKKR